MTITLRFASVSKSELNLNVSTFRLSEHIDDLKIYMSRQILFLLLIKYSAGPDKKGMAVI